MGLHFGNLRYIRGIVYYSLSPHEQKAFAGCISKGIPNMFKHRMFPGIYYWLPPMVICVAVYQGVEEMYRLSKKKNPKDYIDEVDPNPPEEVKVC